MLQNSFYAISGTFYTLINNTDLYLSYFILSYVFLGHNDSVEWGLTVSFPLIELTSPTKMSAFELVTLRGLHYHSYSSLWITIKLCKTLQYVKYAKPKQAIQQRAARQRSPLAYPNSLVLLVRPTSTNFTSQCSFMVMAEKFFSSLHYCGFLWNSWAFLK